jgi:hypothetical protein
MAWTQWDGSGPAFVFLANSDTYEAVCNFNLPRIHGLAEGTRLALEFSTGGHLQDTDRMLSDMGYGYKVSELKPGEGRVYRIAHFHPSHP